MLEIKTYKGKNKGEEIEGTILVSCDEYYFITKDNKAVILSKVECLEETKKENVELKDGKAIYENKRTTYFR